MKLEAAAAAPGPDGARHRDRHLVYASDQAVRSIDLSTKCKDAIKSYVAAPHGLDKMDVHQHHQHGTELQHHTPCRADGVLHGK